MYSFWWCEQFIAELVTYNFFDRVNTILASTDPQFCVMYPSAVHILCHCTITWKKSNSIQDGVGGGGGGDLWNCRGDGSGKSEVIYSYFKPERLKQLDWCRCCNFYSHPILPYTCSILCFLLKFSIVTLSLLPWQASTRGPWT